MIEMPSATLCRCGGQLALCADCMGWMREHSPRIEANWRVLLKWWGNGYQVEGIGDADTAEGFYLQLYKLNR